MAARNKEKSNAQAAPHPGILAVAARTVGHAAGEAVKVLGLQAGETPRAPTAAVPKMRRGELKMHQTPSARGKRSAHAAQAKRSAESLRKTAGFDDVRYRRIMGKSPAIWSEPDIRYIDGLVASKGNPAPAK
jgi:hypothetical protein